MRLTVAHQEIATNHWRAKRHDLKNVKIPEAEDNPRLIISIKTWNWNIRAWLHMSISTPKLITGYNKMRFMYHLIQD